MATVELRELAEAAQKDYASEIVAGLVNNEIRDLQSEIEDTSEISFIALDSSRGWRIYRRTVMFVLYTAVHELYPSAEVVAQFSANKGVFCELRHFGGGMNEDIVRNIENRMREIIMEDLPIVKMKMDKEQAVKIFKNNRQIEKANLVSSLNMDMVSLYQCGEFYDYLYGVMLGHTGSLEKFALDVEADGILLRTPDMDTQGMVRERVPQPKFSQILAESRQWAQALQCNFVPDLNRINRHGGIGELIRVSEALQEKRISQIADHIAAQKGYLRLILIAGPSSSGKTSFAQRLRVQLRAAQLMPVSISLDDYFVNRVDTPRKPTGEYDYESIDALDVELFNEHMLALLAGEEIVLPTYNFLTGNREWDDTKRMAVTREQPVIVEGIHGLNEKLSEYVPHSRKYKIYISALTQLNIDAHNRISTTDARLMRRLVRDYQFRGSGALKTLKQWKDVREGEEKNIFPYQEEADVMFNSALIYELGILKHYAQPLLQMVPNDIPERAEAKRLLDILQYFDDITAEDEVPNNSLLREFIGKSVFFK
ncbi:MAG: nucleoside kinase [Selenomonas sp.]|uniref:nucleoside kinase n=1 Tax=Selenomonas sp. TaxID=2053611 RepID=UPI0025E6896F|nr:nucleoside kinase [Selenomonas sp.]MCR5757782.1 nucleoside kinase [Selenomonas sp.]